ncbi:N,N-dimethylformamidase beta subunit family domain-containing protein [Roseovarius arcticus]|uniref:N,N-dimethylformamidase beta subunit family domain-containing protein n=1 Tax=Roseovarius arcticus TaxID=2547404 RepID=UPI00111051C0|nr:N,N-dimethylformamidase beta subunit family domain-containing protein [Roseovarius arcticus]
MPLSYITGYTDHVSLLRGGRLKIMASCTCADQFEAALVRMRCGDLNPEGPGFSETVIPSKFDGSYPAREQITNAGSSVLIDMAGCEFTDFTAMAHIWPTSHGDEQVILSRTGPNGAFRLFLSDGCLVAEITGPGGTARLAGRMPLVTRQWYLVAMTFGGGKLTVAQEPYSRSGAGERPIIAECPVDFDWMCDTTAPLLLAARRISTDGEKLRTDCHFNGKVEKPRLARKALTRLSIETLRQAAIPPDLNDEVIGFWDFSREIDSEIVRDLSRNGHHGKTVNLPARAMTGSNWTGEEVKWAVAPDQYGAIHFHDDDIYDADWGVDIDAQLPDDLPSGAYAIRVTAGNKVERLPFFVRPRPTDKPAPLLYVASTATYWAYANLNPVPFPIAELLSSRLIILHEANRLIDEHPEWGPSLYDIHSDGSGVCYSSRFRPILNFRPGYISSFGANGSNLREYNADTHILDWLEATGQDYDVVTDEDLHREGYPLLARYKAIMTGTHPEYFSAEMWDGVKSYTDGGGRMMVMGGNGFYWRIAFHPRLSGVIEVRRSGPAIRTWETQPGEEYHAFDGKLGGLWRAQGRPPQSIGGVGFISEGFDLSTGYRRTDAGRGRRTAFVFDGVEGDWIGGFGLQGGGAAGVEIDHADTALGTPTHTVILASSEGHTEAYRLVNEEMSITVPTVTAPAEARIAADMVFFETRGGGAVFNTGSIAWAGSLSHDDYTNNVSQITGNVLRRFLDPAPFQTPQED